MTSTNTIESLLQDARQEIAVDDDELVEARRRRDLAGDALTSEFPGARVVPSGSLAHGDANTPLTDWDLVVVVPDANAEYGPDRKNSDTLKERARTALREALAQEFPDLTVTVNGRKRSVLVRFSKPVTPGTVDFTGDVICAIDHPEKGLWIPRYSSWDRSHPEEHNRILRDANQITGSTVAQAVRLLKHWNKTHSKPLCSWHIKVLAVEAITVRTTMTDALQAFFDHAADSLEAGPTEDPAGVGSDIKTNLSTTETVKRLRSAADALRDAVRAEAQSRPLLAQHHLAKLLPEIVPAPDPKELADEDFRAELKRQGTSVAVGVGPASGVALPPNKPWRCA